MANRNWKSGGRLFSMHKDPVLLDCSITIGAAGAVTSVIGPTVTGVTLTATGTYQISLMDNYAGLLFASASVQSPSSGVSGIVGVEIQNAPSAAVSVLNGATLTIKTLSSSDALANPASGSVINVLMYMSNSSANPVQGEA